MTDLTPASLRVQEPRDLYACQVCNCHHHTTEQHGLRDDIGWSTLEEWGD